MPAYPDPPAAARQILENDWSYLHVLDPLGWAKEIARLDWRSAPKAEKEEWCPGWGDRNDYQRPIDDYPVVQLFAREQDEVTISPPVLVVRLTAPDKIIFAQVEFALKKWRETHPLPVSAPGRKAVNATFTNNDFQVWIRNKLIQVGELLAWRDGLENEGQKKYPNSALANWLQFDEKKFSKAKNLLRRVIENRRSLNAVALLYTRKNK